MDIRAIIKDEAERLNIKQAKVCNLAGVSKSVAHYFLKNPTSSIHCDDLLKLIDFCGYEITRKDSE